MDMTLKQLNKLHLPKDTRIEIQGLPAYEVEIKIDQDGKYILLFKENSNYRVKEIQFIMRALEVNVSVY